MQWLFQNLLWFASFFFIATSITNAGSGSLAFSLKIAEKLKPGQTTKDEIIKLLGAPKRVTDFTKLADRRGAHWEYEERGLPRLSISFLSGSKTLDGWVWNIYERDPEGDPKKVFKFFSNSSLLPSTDTWINPHSAPQDCYFRDEKNGIELDYNRVQQRIYAIRRWDPSRKLASDESEQAPQFCIENACSPGVSAKEYFRDVPISKYCKFPNLD